MYSISLNQPKIQTNSVSPITKPIASACEKPQFQQIQPSFGNAQPVQLAAVRTVLVSKDEKEQYSKLSAALDAKGRKQLDALLKSGKLLNNNSDDKSTTLENLYKIISSPRANGLDAQNVLKETVKALENPCSITQRLGNIPKSFKEEVQANAKMMNPEQSGNDTQQKVEMPEHGRSNSCVSASIEFCLAAQNPAEYARFAQNLTSPKVSVEKTIDLKNLTDKTLDAIWLLNSFKIPYELTGNGKAKITLAPDKNAIIRARIQNVDKDRKERSLVDVLMQSTFMNVGSQQAYDALTDTRGGKFSVNNTGLIEFEKTFTESIVANKNKTSITYQEIDENNVLTGYTEQYKNIKKHINDTLKEKEAVIVGCTFVDENKNIVGGHEITIIGATKGKDGKTYYICNDTDDDIAHAIMMPEDILLPSIHHAGLPQKIVEKDILTKDTWVESLENYKLAKAQQ